MTGAARRRLPLVAGIIGLAVIGVAMVAAPRTTTVTGVVVAVDAGSLSDVRGFTLRVAGGETIEFRIGVLETAAAFPPGHLVEHVASGSPVTVAYRIIDGVPTAVRIEDAAPIAT